MAGPIPCRPSRAIPVSILLPILLPVLFQGVATSCAHPAARLSNTDANTNGAASEKVTEDQRPVPDEARLAPLRAVLKNEMAPLPLRLEAVDGLARALGPASVPDLLPLVINPSPRLREAAAVALGTFGGAVARQSLEGQLGQEEDLAVRETIERALVKMEP